MNYNLEKYQKLLKKKMVDDDKRLSKQEKLFRQLD